MAPRLALARRGLRRPWSTAALGTGPSRPRAYWFAQELTEHVAVQPRKRRAAVYEPGNSPAPTGTGGTSRLLRGISRRDRPWDNFVRRHIGPQDGDVADMLKVLGPGAETLDSFVSQVIPQDIRRLPEKMTPTKALGEVAVAQRFEEIGRGNASRAWMNGGGYYSTVTPAVIRRNLLENPAWYTSYTPYQAEISQGRLESLLNFQTMVSDLTALPVANASLLDEGTAGAEAMIMSLNSLPAARAKRPGRTYVVSHLVHETTIAVMQGRAEGFGISLKRMDLSAPGAHDEVRALGDDLVGVMVQYPDTNGGVDDLSAVADLAHERGTLLSAGTDLLALTLLKPPGEWGTDVAFGNSQRFGVPLGYGGPHAAFMAVTEACKRRLPGRLVGVSKDRTGGRALRLALQTREQHIRREKATSNVCTSQALLANMAAMFAVYHGPDQLRQMALRNLRFARLLQAAARRYGLKVSTRTLDPRGLVLFDTVTIDCGDYGLTRFLFAELDRRKIIPGKRKGRNELVFAVSTVFGEEKLVSVVEAFHKVGSLYRDDGPLALCQRLLKAESSRLSDEEMMESIPPAVRRESSFLTHPVFNSHHSETEMLRYMHHLQSKDLSLVHSMIPLGSCTMKLNGTSKMELISNPRFAAVHPHAPMSSLRGYMQVFNDLSSYLAGITGMAATSLQPNSGAQGEFAGLRIISQYHQQRREAGRDICLIPVSAHGTNPASATMAGMRVVSVKCDAATGNLDLVDLEAKCHEHRDRLAAMMITYPSTYGVFEPDIRKICNMVHDHGGLVYMDGANMNAQIGFTSPGDLGADVCHLNLHKTFCIPHGGGGPGVGPICVKEALEPFLPHLADMLPVTSARFGSASILPISWAYILLMGESGLCKATQMALLNANYMLARLKDHYPILYTNKEGRCAHEFIIDARPFKASAGIEAVDIAKRLQDYGFHAPTMSWPVPNTLMIEPTESESKEELDRYVDALISIRHEIGEIEEGKQPRDGNVLRNAPHTQADLILGDDGKWERPYSREQAAYPLPYLREKKFWPSVTRVDDAYGDTNLFCTCPPVEDIE